jgi:hypothetical protein
MSKYASYKNSERRIARLLRGERRGHLGAEDVRAGPIRAEVKHRKQLPQWLKDAVMQANGNVEDGQLAIVILHEHGRHAQNDLVVLPLTSWLDWFGELATDE